MLRVKTVMRLWLMDARMAPNIYLRQQTVFDAGALRKSWLAILHSLDQVKYLIQAEAAGQQSFFGSVASHLPRPRFFTVEFLKLH